MYYSSPSLSNSLLILIILLVFISTRHALTEKSGQPTLLLILFLKSSPQLSTIPIFIILYLFNNILPELSSVYTAFIGISNATDPKIFSHIFLGNITFFLLLLVALEVGFYILIEDNYKLLKQQ